jgi:hypothetical protein
MDSPFTSQSTTSRLSTLAKTGREAPRVSWLKEPGSIYDTRDSRPGSKGARMSTRPRKSKEQKQAEQDQAAAARAALERDEELLSNRQPKTRKLKGPVDVEKQCGVPLPNGLMCTRSLTCKAHSMGAKRPVMGRSKHYDVPLAATRVPDPPLLSRPRSPPATFEMIEASGSLNKPPRLISPGIFDHEPTRSTPFALSMGSPTDSMDSSFGEDLPYASQMGEPSLSESI